MNEYIYKAKALIREKTGINIPTEIFRYDIEESNDTKSFLKSKRRYGPTDGTYERLPITSPTGPYCCGIFLNPHTLRVRAYSKEVVFGILRYSGQAISSEEEFLQIQNNLMEGDKEHILETIIHECGHFIHDQYFDNKAFHIPIAGSTRVRYSRRNALENFAVAFTEFVLEKINKESPRYKKMQKIIEDRRKNVKIFRLIYPWYGLIRVSSKKNQNVEVSITYYNRENKVCASKREQHYWRRTCRGFSIPRQEAAKIIHDCLNDARTGRTITF